MEFEGIQEYDDKCFKALGEKYLNVTQEMNWALHTA